MGKLLKTAASVVTGLALTMSAAVATELPASAATGCKTSFTTSYQSIRAGSQGQQPRAVQCLLSKAGYPVRADGTFSYRDAAQLGAFQRRVGLKVTRSTNRGTWTALIARGSTPTLRYGSRGESVKRLQAALRAAGSRTLPSTGYFGPLTRSAVMSIQRARGWRQTGVANRDVWRALQSGTVVKLSAARRAAPVTRAPSSSSSSTKGARALAFAKNQLGDSYVFGATGPNAWDCSGLTMGAWKYAAGINLPHSSQAQFSRGTRVSKSNLRPGDLVFFYSGISHVAIYAGNGKVVQASRPGRPINIGEMKYMPYQGARRPA